MQNIQNAELVLNEAENQFEIHIEDQTAFVEFVRKGKKIYLTHTEVPKALEGRGIASALIDKTLHYIKANQLILIPSCSFVAAYVNKNSEWYSILSEGYQM